VNFSNAEFTQQGYITLLNRIGGAFLLPQKGEPPNTIVDPHVGRKWAREGPVNGTIPSIDNS